MQPIAPHGANSPVTRSVDPRKGRKVLQMTIVKQLALATATLVLILGLAQASNVLLDRYALSAAVGGAACVDAEGSWVNWPWPNVPALSPPCSAPATAGKITPPSEAK
jgi:hypothetical protein